MEPYLTYLNIYSGTFNTKSEEKHEHY